VADPHAQGKQEGVSYSGTAKAVVHKGQIDTRTLALPRYMTDAADAEKTVVEQLRYD